MPKNGRARSLSKKDHSCKRERGCVKASCEPGAVPSSIPADCDLKTRIRDLEILLAERTTDLANALQRAKSSEQARDATFDHAPFGLLTITYDLVVVSCNREAGQIWGAPCDDLLGKPLWPTPADERADAALRQHILDRLKGGTSDTFEVFSGKRRKWLRLHAARSDGRFVIYLRDITADKKKDEVMSKLWRESRSLTDNSPDLILRFDDHLLCIFANKAAETLAGISSGLCRGKNFHQMGFSPDTAARLDRAMEKAMRTRAIQSDELNLNTPSGKKTFAWRAIPEEGQALGVRSVLVIARDITAQKEEERVRHRLTAAIEEANEGVVVVQPDGTVTYANEAFCRIAGQKKTELMGRHISLLDKERVDARIISAIRESLQKNKPWSGRFMIRKKENAELQCELSVAPVRDASGTVTGFVGIAGDVTREAELEQQLRESQKLEAIGTLSGGIAHDFNNMLAVILGNAELALDDTEKGSPVRHNLDQLVTAALRGRDLVKQILSFSRKSPRNARPFSLSGLVQETANLLRSTLPTTIAIKLDIQTRDDTLVADPTHLQQVFLNLVTNASFAMGQEGVLTIGLANVRFDTQTALPDPTLRLGDYLVLSVEDTGPGMDESVRQRIFEPFFTTKQVGEGTGLGLSVVYGIVKTYDGAITVHSVPGKGALFRVFLPQGHVPPAETSAMNVEPATGKGRILFVDDEEPIVSMGERVLSKLGYEVHTETDPEQALKTFSEDPGRFDLVITDQAMPRMAGLTLARYLLEKRPGLPIILSTGYSAVVNDKTKTEWGIREIIMKPLTRQELAKAVKEALTEK